MADSSSGGAGSGAYWRPSGALAGAGASRRIKKTGAARTVPVFWDIAVAEYAVQELTTFAPRSWHLVGFLGGLGEANVISPDPDVPPYLLVQQFMNTASKPLGTGIRLG